MSSGKTKIKKSQRSGPTANRSTGQTKTEAKAKAKAKEAVDINQIKITNSAKTEEMDAAAFPILPASAHLFWQN